MPSINAHGAYDKHSVFADPLFVNPAAMDYRLQPNSPARKLGFRDIDGSRIGLKQSFMNYGR